MEESRWACNISETFVMRFALAVSTKPLFEPDKAS